MDWGMIKLMTEAYIYIHIINTTGKIIPLAALLTWTCMERCMIYEQTSGKHIIQKSSYLDSCPGTLLTKVNLLEKQLHVAIPFLRVLKLVSAKIWVRSIGTFFADKLLVKHTSMQLARFHLPDIAPFNFKYGLKILSWWFGNFFAPGKQQLSKRFHSCSPKPALTASVGAFAWEMAWFRENMSAEEGENRITVQCNHITYLGSTPHPGGQRKGLCIGIPY